MDSTSNVVLLRMVEYLQAELNAATQRRVELENINEAQARVIRTLKSDLVDADLSVHEATATTARTLQGCEIVLRSLEGMYQQAKHLYLIKRLEAAEWDEFLREMMRSDIGYAIMHGAPVLAELEAHEEIDDQETVVDDEETETEWEDSEDEMEVEI